MFAAQGIAHGASRARPHWTRAARGHRDARCDGGAFDLSGGYLFRDRHDTGPHGQSPPDDRAVRDVRGRPTETSSSPSATTNSGDGSAGSSMRSALAGDERFATNRARVQNYQELRPLLAEQSADTHTQRLGRGVESRRRAVRLGARGCGGSRRSPARCAKHDRNRQSRVGRCDSRSRGSHQAVRDARFSALRTSGAGAAHRTRFCGRTADSRRRRSRRCGRLKRFSHSGPGSGIRDPGSEERSWNWKLEAIFQSAT